MSRKAWFAVVFVAATALGGGLFAPSEATAAAQQPAAADDLRIRELLLQIEQAATKRDRDAFLQLLTPDASRVTADRFLDSEFRAGATRVVVQERERVRLAGTLPGNGYALTVDVFIESSDRARIATWEIEVRRSDDQRWRIVTQKPVSSVDNIYRLVLNTKQQYDVKNFTIVAEDLELTLAEGSVFTVETDQGITGLVLMGRGDMHFHPTPRTEIEQVRIYGGGPDTLDSRFDAAFVRVGTFEAHADRRLLVPRAAVDPRDAKRAEQIFREESAKSFVLDLADLTRDTWSLLPGPEDFLAEIRTRRFDTLTYARSTGEAEDISFFERRRHRNIAVYASKDKLLARGRFYNEDDLSPFDVLDYDINVTYSPERLFLDGDTTMRLRVRATSLGQLTLRLADSLIVRSITSDKFGRLFNLRVSNQNTVLVNLPMTMNQDDELTIRVEYGGRLEPQEAARELSAVQQDVPVVDDPVLPKPEPSFLYSNRSYWHPQPTITDYATATINVTIPAPYAVVASGTPAADSPRAAEPTDAMPAGRVFTFNAERPLRYLAFLATRFGRAERRIVNFDQDAVTPSGADTNTPMLADAVYDKLELLVETNPRQAGKAKGIADRAVDIARFYESLVDDSPYATFTVGLIEGILPGGHSPAYFAALNQPLSNSTITWRNDPAAFANYPEFFLAHEMAHQWWGQAVGWRNYHEQWLSEGFAQYFAALYAQHLRGDDVFAGVLKQMSRWAIDESDQGPVYLGYRVGHIRNDGRAFRAVIYDKGAMLLHMLRQLMGDDAFFRGIRRFYSESRFTKVGTDDLRKAMEAEGGQPLDRFFERWIYNSTLPKLTFTYRLEPAGSGQQVVLHFEQGDEIFDLPVAVTLKFTDRPEVTVIVPVTDKTVDYRMPLQGTLRAAEIDRDAGGLADVGRN